MQDSILNYGVIKDKNIRIFTFHQERSRPYEFKNNVHISVTFEVDLNLRVIEREVYTIIDWMGDIGGLGEAYFFISWSILSLIHFEAVDNMIIRELFRVS